MFRLIVALMLLANSTVGQAYEWDSPYTKTFMEDVGPGVCVRAALLSLEVTGVVESGVYQVGARHNGVLVMQGLLQTVATKFTQPGRIRTDLVIAYMGVKELPLENGFMGKFGMWKECKPTGVK